MLLINNYFLIKFHRRLNHYDSLKINRHENLKIYVGHKKVKRKSRSLLIIFDKQTINLALAMYFRYDAVKTFSIHIHSQLPCLVAQQRKDSRRILLHIFSKLYICI